MQKYYMISFAGFWSDDSGSMNVTTYFKQESPVFHFDSFREAMIDAYGKSSDGERDHELYVVIYFMREVTEFEYEVNKSESKNAIPQ